MQFFTSNFTGNKASENGGAFELFGAWLTVDMDDVQLSGNNAMVDGGALYVETGPRVVAKTTVLENNYAVDGSGGAVAAQVCSSFLVICCINASMAGPYSA